MLRTYRSCLGEVFLGLLQPTLILSPHVWRSRFISRDVTLIYLPMCLANTYSFNHAHCAQFIVLSCTLCRHFPSYYHNKQYGCDFYWHMHVTRMCNRRQHAKHVQCAKCYSLLSAFSNNVNKYCSSYMSSYNLYLVYLSLVSSSHYMTDCNFLVQCHIFPYFVFLEQSHFLKILKHIKTTYSVTIMTFSLKKLILLYVVSQTISRKRLVTTFLSIDS